MAREEIPFFAQLLAVGAGAHNIEQKIDLAQSIRLQSTEMNRNLDLGLLSVIERDQLTLREIKASQGKVREMIEALTAPPWYPALCLRKSGLREGKEAQPQRVEVICGTTIRWVTLAKDVAPDDIHPGDELCLSHDLNVVLGKIPGGNPRRGETAIFDRYDGEQLVIKTRDEELLATAAAQLKRDELKPGCRVRFDRGAYMVFEKIGEPEPFRLNEVPHATREQVGGQDEAWDVLFSTATTALVDPDKATMYGLGGKGAILMVGPPGCGKTLMARTLAAKVEDQSGRKCHLFVAKPAEWESPWVGMTEQNIRELFAACRRAAEGGLVILFLDEVESVGRTRGSFAGHHSDRALAALLAEMDGLTGRGNVLVIAATNRKDLVDPALLDRLSDVEIPVRRPDMRGARAIFGVHLAPSLPYCPNGTAAQETRRQIIEAAVARLYCPNSDTAELSRIKFRDGKVRVVAARELASGRLIEQIARAARQNAFLRDIKLKETGLQVADIEAAIDAALQRLATTLTIRNVHSYLPDLPTDVDVVAVEPIARKVSSPHRYINA